MSEFLNLNLDTASRALGQVGNVQIEYGHPVNIPQNFTGVCPKTTQNTSALTIQNLSNTFDATVYVDPDPTGKGFHTLPANDPTPLRVAHNWNGAKLIVANVSQEAATVKVQLVDLG